MTIDIEDHLAEIVTSADQEALADLRAQVLAPLAAMRPSTTAKLTQTLRAWLLHQGRREDVAAALFVYPQTVRYRMGQLRDAYGDRLDDPAVVLAATIALGGPDSAHLHSARCSTSWSHGTARLAEQRFSIELEALLLGAENLI